MNKTCTVSFCLWLLTSAAYANDLSSIYNAALEHDIEFAAARATQEADSYDVTIARAPLLPSAEASYEWKHVDSESDDLGASADRDLALQGWEVRASQTLFDLNSWYRYQAAKSANTVSDARLTVAEQSLRLRSVNAYIDALRVQSSLVTAKTEIKLLQRVLEQTQDRYRSGVASKIDVLEIQSKVDLATANKVAQEATLNVRRDELAQLSGLDIHALADLQTDVPLSEPVPNSVKDWIKKGLEMSPAISMSQMALDAQRLSRNADRANHLPKVNVFASYKQGDEFSPLGGNASVEQKTLVYGIRVSMPLLAGGGLYAKTKQAALKFASSSVELDRQQRLVEQNIRSLFLHIKTDIVTAKARKQALISAEQALNAVQSGYESGTRSLVDVLNAQKEFVSAQNDASSARYNYVQHWAALRFYAGILSTDDIAVINQWLVSS